MKYKEYRHLSINNFIEQTLYYGIHNHSYYSNLRGLDSIVKPTELIDDAIMKGHRGIAISDHESISGHIKMMNYMKSLRKDKEKYNEMIEKELDESFIKKSFKNYNVVSKMPDDFKLGLGNEIYLLDEETMEEYKENYYTENRGRTNHMVLQALDEEGHFQLRELSSIAWGNHFKTGLVERVPITRTDLKNVIGENKGHLVCSTACLGGNLGGYVLELLQIQARPHTEAEVFEQKLKIHNFIQFCIETFGKDNFYIEVQPNDMIEQVGFNKVALTIAKGYGLSFIITTDTHYLNKEDRFVHKAYLTSRGNEDREVDDFYNTTYNMTLTEIYNYWTIFGSDNDFKTAILNTLSIWERTEQYDLSKSEQIPLRKLPDDFEVQHIFKNWYSKYEYIEKVANSEYEQDRFFMVLLENGFLEKKLEYTETILSRINEELKELWLISERLKQRMLAYYSLTELIIGLMWKDDGGNSIVACGRGSVNGMLICWITNIIQMNPLDWNLPAYRHISHTRPELPDVDIDTETIKREQVFNAIADYFDGQFLNIATFKKEGSKSAVQTSARGLGIDNDISMAISSLIPFERGSHWSLHDCVYGNEEKEREPVKEFVNEISQYPNWLETAMKIEGVVCGRSIHASGSIAYCEGITSQTSMMKAPNGKNITAFDMVDESQLGGVKLDLLTTQATTIIGKTLELLVEEGKIEWQGSLKKTYDKYVHPDVLDYKTIDMWKLLETNSIQDIFQFSTEIGKSTAKALKPRNLIELAHANSLMRLMGDGEITPIEKYISFRNDISLWYKEMETYNLTKEEVLVLEKHLLELSGVSATQEDIMEMSMNNKIVGFNLTQANKLRKAVAKKSEKVMKEVKKMMQEVANRNNVSENMQDYFWKMHILPQAGYSFSKNHVIPYSGIALQEMNLAYKYGSLFWNCAVLICNSGADGMVIEDEESKTKATEYGKIAKAIGEMQSAGVEVALPNINSSGLTFKPDEENNRILFGLKGISGVGDNDIRHILANRPYNNFGDFLERSSSELGTTTTIALIKAGMFDSMVDRAEAMEHYISSISKKVKSIGMVQMNKMIEMGLVPNGFDLECRFVKFRKYIFGKQFFAKNDENTKTKKWYRLNDISANFFSEHFIHLMQEDKDFTYDEFGNLLVLDKNFDKYYKEKIEKLSEYAKSDKALNDYNMIAFYEVWDKYCGGTISKWEMDSLNFYHSEHELERLDTDRYSLVNFNELPETPEISERVERGTFKFNRYKLNRICGTILDKDKNKHILQVLTPNGVVAVKFHKGAFTHYDKQLSEIDPATGTKTVIEKSWFARGNKIMVVGFRRDDQFVAKKYAKSVYQHTVELITEVAEDGISVRTFQKRVEV